MLTCALVALDFVKPGSASDTSIATATNTTPTPLFLTRCTFVFGPIFVSRIVLLSARLSFRPGLAST
jgi:hypothetical protein